MEVTQLLLLICIVFKSCLACPFEELTHVGDLSSSGFKQHIKNLPYDDKMMTMSSESSEDYDILQQINKESVPNPGKASVVEIPFQSEKNPENLDEINPQGPQLSELYQTTESSKEQSHESPIQQTHEHEKSVLKLEKESPLVSKDQSQSTKDFEEHQDLTLRSKYNAIPCTWKQFQTGEEDYNATISYINKLRKDLRNTFFNLTLNDIENSKNRNQPPYEKFTFLCEEKMLMQVGLDMMDMMPTNFSEKYEPGRIYLYRVTESTEEICDELVQTIRKLFE